MSQRGSRIVEWAKLLAYPIAALVLISILQTSGVLRIQNVSSGSMRETLGVGDRILVSRLPYLGSSPVRGDVVVFGHGDTWDDQTKSPAASPLVAAVRAFGDVTGIGPSSVNYTVKRVIGLGGDTVSCCDTQGRVKVNGQPSDEPYVFEDLPFQEGALDCSTTPRSSRCFATVTVPPGRLLVMGDHRSNSADSVMECRYEPAPSVCARYVDMVRVTGKVFARAWPPGPVS